MMQEINRLVRKAARRLFVVRYVKALTFGLVAAVGCVVLLRIIERLVAFRPDWNWTWGGFIAAAFAGAAAWVFFTRHDRLAVARELDESANLRESISTAMCLGGSNDPWSQASIAQAREVASKVHVAQAFPIRTPKLWPVPVLGAVIFALLGLVPQADLLKLMSKAQAKEEQAKAMEEATAEVKTMEQKLDELLAKVDDGSLKEDDAAATNEPPTPPATPDDVRREAVRKLTTMQDRLEQLRGGEKLAALEQMNQRLEQLKMPKGASTELSKLVQKLQQGKFDEANQALSEMMNKLGDGSLTEEQKQALAKQLEQLAEQMKELAEQQSQLADALKDMGLDPKLATDSDALKKALENMSSLSQEQREQMMQMAMALQQSNKMCQSMGQACKNAGSAMSSGEGMEGELGELGEQLSELEAMQAQLDSLEAAMGECQSQMAALGECMGQKNGSKSNPFANAFNKQGKGVGPGIGSGGKPTEQDPTEKDADVATNRERVKGRNTGGPIISSSMVEGDQIRGESVQQFSNAVQAGAAEAAEAVETMTVPREYHDALKHYFGRLESKAKPAAGSPAPAPTAPASDSKD